MPLPALSPPPRTGNRVLDDWLYLLWRKTGESSMVAPLSIEGQAATAVTAVAIPPTVTSSGAPTMPASPGVYAVDDLTGDVYYNPTGEGGDWLLL